eukprot:TRINITY_DN2126_c1_g1_i1.p1 TRINITY_DN2126_c1_g1~~TRINITY_DN2126_c1_g1_i1.p1  ORF type:complete len:111 (-),score=40.29 TRINITY_DN2126_c1_g1_i1:88-420(-)
MDNKTQKDHEDTEEDEKVESASGGGDDCKVFRVRGVTYELDRLRDRLLDHYIIGLAIKDNLITRAVHWYTGEAVEDDEDDEEDDEEEEDDGREDDKGRIDEQDDNGRIDE